MPSQSPKAHQMASDLTRQAYGHNVTDTVYPKQTAEVCRALHNARFYLDHAAVLIGAEMGRNAERELCIEELKHLAERAMAVARVIDGK